MAVKVEVDQFQVSSATVSLNMEAATRHMLIERVNQGDMPASVGQQRSRDAVHQEEWRQGTAAPISTRFARGRVRAAQNDQPRAEE